MIIGSFPDGFEMEYQELWDYKLEGLSHETSCSNLIQQHGGYPKFYNTESLHSDRLDMRDAKPSGAHYR